MKNLPDLSHLSDNELLGEFGDSIITENENLVFQLLRLVEMEKRRLFRHGSSLWDFITDEFGMEGGVAQRRIQAAQMLVQFPELLSRLESGKMNISLLELAQGYFYGKKLSSEEKWEILESLEGLSCRTAARQLKGRAPDSVRIPREKIRVISHELSELNFVADDDLLQRLEDIRGLLAHSHPGISLSGLVDYLAKDYLKRHHPVEKAKRAEEREAKKASAEKASKEESTVDPFDHPPAPVTEKHADDRAPSQAMTWKLVNRDGYVCSYADPVTRKKCDSTYGLERDHKLSYALGGKTELSNLRYLCRAHNVREAILQFGIEKMNEWDKFK